MPSECLLSKIYYKCYNRCNIFEFPIIRIWKLCFYSEVNIRNTRGESKCDIRGSGDRGRGAGDWNLVVWSLIDGGPSSFACGSLLRMTGSTQLAFEKTSTIENTEYRIDNQKRGCTTCAPFLPLPFFAEVAAR